MECCPRKPPYAGAICSDSLSPCRQGHLWLWAQQLVQTGHHALSCISPEATSPVTYPAAPVQSQWQESQHWSQEYRWIKLLHTYKSEIRIILHSMCSCEQESGEREEHPLWKSLLPLGLMPINFSMLGFFLGAGKYWEALTSCPFRCHLTCSSTLYLDSTT